MKLRGLYVITEQVQFQANSSMPPSLIQDTEQAILGGAALVQYRNKSLDSKRREKEAKALAVLCHRYQRPLIINDDVELARRVKADGVHLGRDDSSLIAARQQLGQQAIIGISCYNDLSLALAAEQQGADYVAFGSFFPSPTKPTAVVAAIELLQRARKQLNIPIIAIGGITPRNGADLIKAGASALAVISGVFGQADIGQAAQRYARLFESSLMAE